MPGHSMGRKLATRLFAQLPIEGRRKLRWIAQLSDLGIYEEEKEIGGRPFFAAPTPGWLSPLLPVPYSKVWEPFGAAGINYISVSLHDSQSKSELLPIFDPLSPYYQAWFGVYAIIGKSRPFGFEDGRPCPDLIAPLIIADQDEWQRRITGTILPGSKFNAQSEAEQITLPNIEQKVFLFHGRMASHSVLIPPAQQTPEARRYFPLPQSHLWDQVVEPRHALDLAGFGALWADYSTGTTFFAYGVGSDFVDKRGQRHDYTGIVEPELRGLLSSLKFRPHRDHVR